MRRNQHLPLTETTYYILLALLKTNHGYAIMQDVETMSEGEVRIAAGTMYGAIENLLKLGWIIAVPSTDSRRKMYHITPIGKSILALETERIRKLSTLASQFDF
ncbi:PadR family transcriptional regulator [Streptococcus azizii]|uniref:PadR family transcriptional regulator n=1 Tax=Streptococcus azizii TaxID=1579424 RepID=A0AB36JS70_9STRE|nr:MULTISPECIES: helix-turn-helix transcriptional regulator [Streptococcus]MBF0776007.1 helix-turn-helix transcriptional regulator [Streptococcus sp. 19428wD3_AN2]ONK26339.1 PadR family transcriptional regulator [Streptococcus azizii]ONK28176.1 PadR family transcriptional regulator [Streptococcus azizii]ONK29086.1 PadR family transcriptional regulator [Streptococcus azizii]TFU83801.1 PadR family transcriptional regulator [Streptococcus sp. AN2]